MSYITLNPNENINKFTDVKPLSSYSKELLQNIRMVTFNPDADEDDAEDGAVPFGSFIYKIQKYPGDVDLIESFHDCCSVNDVIKKFIVNLKRVVKDVIGSKLHYFSEFKAGLDHRYDVNIGYCRNGRYMFDRDLKRCTRNLFSKGLLDDVEYNKVMSVLDSNMDNGDGYDIVFNVFRNRRVLRWSAKEVLAGKKDIGKKIISLEEALHDKTSVKIDVLLIYNNRFIEMTNFVILEVKDPESGLDEWINVDPNTQVMLRTQLPIEIEKLYLSNFYYSPFKMVKRIYSLARNQHDIYTLEKIIPFISSDTSALYQSKSEIDVLLLILENVKNPPIKTMNDQLDLMKGRLVNLLQFDDFQLDSAIQLIDLARNEKDLDKVYEILKTLNSKIIKPKINYLTVSYLNEIGFNPPPLYLLPPVLTYALRKRSPDEMPELPIIIHDRPYLKPI